MCIFLHTLYIYICYNVHQRLPGYVDAMISSCFLRLIIFLGKWYHFSAVYVFRAVQ